MRRGRAARLLRGRRVRGPLQDRLPHRLRSARVLGQLLRRRFQLSWREAPTLQDRVATGSALCGVYSRRVLHALQVGHHGHEGRVAHSSHELRATTACDRPEEDENDQERMSRDERRFHEAARLSDEPECVKRT